MKMIYQVQENVSQYMIIDLNMGIAFFSQKTNSSFTNLHAGIA
jgi:hypothetical protein